MKHNLKMALLISIGCVALSGCSTWSTSDVANVRPNQDGMIKVVAPENIKITEGDITDRTYQSLGDISVTVNKTTIFHPEPTRELVNIKLKEEAAKLGADAVIHVRYGSGGVSLMSWGSLDGKGRAVEFTR